MGGERLTFFTIIAFHARPVLLLCAVLAQMSFGVAISADLTITISYRIG